MTPEEKEKAQLQQPERAEHRLQIPNDADVQRRKHETDYPCHRAHRLQVQNVGVLIPDAEFSEHEAAGHTVEVKRLPVQNVDNARRHEQKGAVVQKRHNQRQQYLHNPNCRFTLS